jgi:hypothetical protein
LKQACLIECSKLAGATLFGSENQPCSAYFLCPCSPVGCSDALLHLQAQQLDSLNTSELLSMLSFGADRILSNQAGQPPSDADLERILDRSQDAAQKAAAALAAEKAAADKAADKAAAAEAGGDAGAGSSAAAETAGTSAAAAAAVVKQEAAGVKQEAEQDGEAEAAAAAAAAAGDNSIPNGGAVLM